MNALNNSTNWIENTFTDSGLKTISHVEKAQSAMINFLMQKETHLLRECVISTVSILSYEKPLPVMALFLSFGLVYGWSLSVRSHIRSCAFSKLVGASIVASKENDKKALVIAASPSTNWNGALFGESDICIYEELAKTHQITLTCIDSFETLKKFADSSQEIHPLKYDIIIIQGHGNNKSIDLGPDFTLTENEGKPFDENTEKSLKLIRKLASTNCSVVLQSCSTGKGNENIAQLISRYAKDATVSAPCENINRLILSSKNKENLSVEFVEAGLFSLFKKRKITQVYKNGKLDSSRSCRSDIKSKSIILSK